MTAILSGGQYKPLSPAGVKEIHDTSLRLLENTPWNTTRISFEVGCTDQSYFSKVFKKIEGMSPSDYRKRMKR